MKTTQDSYPPWSIKEVLFFYFIVSSIVGFVTWHVSLSFTRSFFGVSGLSDMLENPYDATSQIFFNITNILTSIVMVIALYIRVCKKYNLSFKEGFRIKPPENFGYIYLIPIVAVMLFTAFMMRDFKPEDITKIPIFSYISTAPGLILFLLAAITVAPVYEELFFRGYLYPAIEQASNTRTAIIVVTIFFALSHIPQLRGDWAGVFTILCVGLILTVLRALTNSTKICIIAHFAYNLSLPLISLIGQALKSK